MSFGHLIYLCTMLIKLACKCVLIVQNGTVLLEKKSAALYKVFRGLLQGRSQGWAQGVCIPPPQSKCCFRFLG